MYYVILLVLHSHHFWVSAVGFSEAYNEAVKLHDDWRAKENAENWRLKHGDLSTSEHDVTTEGTTYL